MSSQQAKDSNMSDIFTKKRFACVVTLEDFSVDICPSHSGIMPRPRSFCWDEMRVVVERAGVTQHTRWLSPFLALGATCDLPSNNDVNSADGKAEKEPSDSIELRWSSINTAGFTVFFRHLDKETDCCLAEAAEYDRSVHSANLKYFNLCDADMVDDGRAKVAPKVVHPFVLSVECRNSPHVCSAFEGEQSDTKKTGVNLEKISAYYEKGMSVMSALFKKVIKKNSVDNTKEQEHLEENWMDDNNKTEISHGFSDSISFSGLYVSDTTVDPSKAYNAVGGRHRFSLKLHPSKAEFSGRRGGVPLVLYFTMVAHFEEAAILPPLPPPVRDFSSMVILLDQIVLDVTNAERNSNCEGDQDGKKVEAYAVGFTSDTSHTMEFCTQTPFMAPQNRSAIESDKLLLVDFYSLHGEKNEREITKLDMKSDPISFCIISSGCKTKNKKRIGNRVIMYSRFKTAADGLCKSSYKCQLHFGLLRRYSSGGIEIDRFTQPIDLAQIINRENYPDKSNTIVFSHGECMSFRLRRRCFVKPEHHSCDLLMPFDYDNSGIEADDLDCNFSDDDDITSCLAVSKIASMKENENVDMNDNDHSDYINNEAQGNCGVEEVISGDGVNDVRGKSSVTSSDQLEKEVAEKTFLTQLLLNGALDAYNSYEHKTYGPPEEPSTTAKTEEEVVEVNSNAAVVKPEQKNNEEKEEKKEEFREKISKYNFEDKFSFFASKVEEEGAEVNNLATDKNSCLTFLPSCTTPLTENVTSEEKTKSNPFERNSFEVLSGAFEAKNTTLKNELPVIFF